MPQHLPFSRTDIELTPRDIQFECVHCENILIVDKDGEGLELVCPHCGGVVIVPPFEQSRSQSQEKESPGESASEPAVQPAQPAEEYMEPTFDFSSLSAGELAERLESVKNKLKENASQRMELQGHINRLTIEMHRLTLKMERAQRKHRDLEAEHKALTAAQAAN